MLHVTVDGASAHALAWRLEVFQAPPFRPHKTGETRRPQEGDRRSEYGILKYFLRNINATRSSRAGRGHYCGCLYPFCPIRFFQHEAIIHFPLLKTTFVCSL